MQAFAYRIEIGPGIFALTGALVLLSALATVSYQSIRVALADPVKSLRYERAPPQGRYETPLSPNAGVELFAGDNDVSAGEQTNSLLGI